MSEIKPKQILISFILSLSIGSFFYLLVLQLPYVSKSRLLLSFLFSLGVMWPIYKTSLQVWVECVDKFKFIVLFASFIGLIVTTIFFYHPKISYLFYGQHELEVVVDGDKASNGQVDVTALFTELQTESYSQFQISGGKWVRNENTFSASGSESTKLTWKGWTGSEITIRFRKSPKAGSVKLIWDGTPQAVELTGNQDETLSIVHQYERPVLGKLLLWLLSTLVTGYILGLLLWLEGKLGVYKVAPSALMVERGKLKTITNIVIVVILFLSVLNVFLPINPNRLIRDRDDSAFLYIGRQVLNGQIPYLDIWDHKGPLIYYINALGLFMAMGSEWGVWFIQILWLFIAGLLAYKVLSNLTGEIPALLSIFLMSILIVKPLGGGNYVEEYALLPLFLCWFGFQKFLSKNETKWLWLVGFSTGLAFLLRPNLISGQVGVLAIVLFLSWKDKNSRPLYAALAGLVCILVPVILYFYQTGALNEMFSAFYVFNRYHYIGGSFDAFEYLYKGLESYTNLWGIIIFGLLLVTLFFFKPPSYATRTYYIIPALLGGFVVEIWLSNLAPYQYKHYYILWSAYFSVFASFLFAWLTGTMFKFLNGYFSRMPRFLFTTSLLILVIILLSNSMTANFHTDIFNAEDNTVKELLAEITPYSDCCSYLLVWGAEPQINFELDKESPSRFFYQYALFSDGYATSVMVDEFVRDIAIKQPLIIDTSETDSKVSPIDRDAPNFSRQTAERLQPFLNYVANNYYPAHKMSNGWVIYLPKP